MSSIDALREQDSILGADPAPAPLPSGSLAQKSAEPQNTGNQPLKNISICLLEDDKGTATVYMRWLQVAGARVHWLASLEAFKDQMGSGPQNWTQHPATAPDILLCDLVLPDGDGIEALHLWRKAFTQSPIVVATAFATVENAVECLRSGAFDFVRKPLRPEELVLTLRRASEHGMLVRENETLSAAVRILGMAQTLSSISDKISMLKTYARILFRELMARECFLFFYHQAKGQVELLFECRGGSSAKTDASGLQLEWSKRLGRSSPVSPHLELMRLDLTTAPAPDIWFDDRNGYFQVEMRSPTGNAVYLCLPLRERNTLTPAAQKELHPITIQAARSFQSADVADWMCALSFVDDLTGLYNQRFLDVALNNEYARSQRYATPFAVMFLDLDGFKDINDTHGHMVGSQVLREVGLLIKKMLRDSDILLRFGGDEFVAILPNTPLEGARVVSDRLRCKIADTYFDVSEVTQIKAARDLKVTASIGLSAYPECSEDSREVLQLADNAMYESKRTGKNKITCAQTKPPKNP